MPSSSWRSPPDPNGSARSAAVVAVAASAIATLSESGEFTAGKNGNVVGTLVLEAPSPADVGFECPPGQDEALTTVSYNNVQITDEDSGATFSLGGPFSAGTPGD